MITLGQCDHNIVTHCSNRCTSCSHHSPVSPKYEMSPEALRNDLEAIKPFIRFQTCALVGGEPTLHPKLIDMMTIVRESGVGGGVLLITHGRHLPNMKTQFWDAMQYLQVQLQISQYPTLPKETIDFAIAQTTLYGIPIGITKFDEFYTQFKNQPDDGVKTFKDCHWKSSCYTLHAGAFWRCPQAAFMENSFPAYKSKGLALDDMTDQSLNEFLNCADPFEACKICSGGFNQKQPWSESKRGDWIKNSTLGDEKAKFIQRERPI